MNRIDAPFWVEGMVKELQELLSPSTPEMDGSPSNTVEVRVGHAVDAWTYENSDYKQLLSERNEARDKIVKVLTEKQPLDRLALGSVQVNGGVDVGTNSMRLVWEVTTYIVDPPADTHRVIIINSDDWEGCYIDGLLVSEGHSLGEGDGLIGFLQEQSDEYNFQLSDITSAWIADDDEEELYATGCFPNVLSDLKGVYN